MDGRNFTANVLIGGAVGHITFMAQHDGGLFWSIVVGLGMFLLAARSLPVPPERS